ncbi:MAG: FAD-dependent oxidoreductase [Deltaproteobacteria bacterium]|nr:FAD-dependent oxidoreductase [Deltaproteobacteria bacterium]MBW2082795.1 FAD-dependent oxidoreductase [Deltaproteobacteria bacterium]
MHYNVIIVGAGPAGIFAALTLVENGMDGIVILEKGKDIMQRDRGRSSDVLCGWGGAGAYSDGKLTLSPEVGGNLGEYIGTDELSRLLAEADEIYVKHGAPGTLYGDISPKVEDLADKARMADLQLIPMRIRHIGTENCAAVLKGLKESLEGPVQVRTDCEVTGLIVEDDTIRGVKLANGEVVEGKYVIVAPGRSGAPWMKSQADLLGLRTSASPVDIGVRVELPAVVLKEITDITYESKLIYYSKSFDDKVRTFCMNPFGEVVLEKSDDMITVNGHSYAGRKTENTNFAILVSSAFTEPFDDPIAYGRYIARLANLLGKGVIVQRLGDLLSGRRSTPERISKCLTRPTLKDAAPGDLSFVFPYRLLTGITEMLKALDKLAPGVYSRHTLLYGVEVKFYSNTIAVSNELETSVKNLFVIGDGAGITRGLLQASASGIWAARAISARAGLGTVTPP